MIKLKEGQVYFDIEERFPLLLEKMYDKIEKIMINNRLIENRDEET